MHRGKKIVNERDGQLQAIDARNQTVYFIRAKHSGKTQRGLNVFCNTQIIT